MVYNILVVGANLSGKSATINALFEQYISQTNAISKTNKISTEYTIDVANSSFISGLQFSNNSNICHTNVKITEYNLSEMIYKGKLTNDFVSYVKQSDLIIYVLSMTKGLLGAAELKIINKILSRMSLHEQTGIFSNILFTFNNVYSLSTEDQTIYAQNFLESLPDQKYYIYDSHVVIGMLREKYLLTSISEDELTRIVRAYNYYTDNNVLAFDTTHFISEINEIITGCTQSIEKCQKYLTDIAAEINKLIELNIDIDYDQHDYTEIISKFSHSEKFIEHLNNLADNNVHLIHIFKLENTYLKNNIDKPSRETFNTFFNLLFKQNIIELTEKQICQWITCYTHTDDEIFDLIDDTEDDDKIKDNDSLLLALLEKYPIIDAVRNLYDMMIVSEHNFIIKQFIKNDKIIFDIYSVMGKHLPANLDLYNNWPNRSGIDGKFTKISTDLGYGNNKFIVMFLDNLRDILLSSDTETGYTGNSFDSVLAEYSDMQTQIIASQRLVFRNKIDQNLLLEYN